LFKNIFEFYLTKNRSSAQTGMNSSLRLAQKHADFLNHRLDELIPQSVGEAAETGERQTTIRCIFSKKQSGVE
jgi:hypothetical protein